MDGIALIKSKISHLPGGPGVYRMLNQKGDVLYVGKAKNLKNRVNQYTQPERMGGRIRKMVFETRELVVVSTATEAEALLLEANLIKSLRPRYNILFRDDSSYVSVLITDEETPMIRSFRGARKIKGDYFGPYPSAMAVYQTLDLMERAFRLRTCAPGFFRYRTRPCLKYDIKRCSAPCVGKIAPDKYRQVVASAKKFLRGDTQIVLADLQTQMAEASRVQDYELAGQLRDSIKAISSVSGADRPMSHGLPEADVFALVANGGKSMIQVFYYRHGQHVGNHAVMLNNEDEQVDDAETLRQFLAQHYASRIPPAQILCNLLPNDCDALAEALSISAARKVSIAMPSRGDKSAIMQQVVKNARDALARKLADGDDWRNQLMALGKLLNLQKPIECLECYDISNISGKMPVASLVVAGQTGMLRNRYRRYNIKRQDTPDDYAMMAEVLERRLARGMKEQAEALASGEKCAGLPDVIMVDGGKGQLGVLVKVAQQLGLFGTPDCPTLCAIAKGEERDKGLETIFIACEKEGKVDIRDLPIYPGTPLIFVLQRIRDEAHRFAITFHRKKRETAISHSRLDDIPGIGPRKKKELLLHFGSLKEIEGADIHQLMKVPGLSKKLAQQIYDFFHL
ncbi:MAG TPA: excinuclease ABC subunit UvrC [Alphaproteobacteria bacterium]|nr:excinuclease ABC subunit UvrC [Alphaproteobacteria bacterium]